MPENMPNLDTSLFAHGIKNRLCLIRSRLQLIELERNEKGSFDSIYRELDGINESVCRLIATASSEDNCKIKFNAGDIIYQCISEKLPQANLRGIKILHQIEDNLNIYASKPSFRESLINLLQNAVDACPKKDGEILVRGYASRGMVRISICDNGCGVPFKNRKNIFKPFFTTKKGGSGIGLYSCKKFAHESGGRLTLSGRSGGGTRLTLIIPSA